MDILSLEIKNFGPIEEAYINLTEQGLVNIEGVNEDDPSANSNGSGKSTLADALYWSLFGSTARGVSGDEVIANFAGKDCYVATLIQDGADRYLVERWRKKKGFKGKVSGLALSRTDTSGTVADLTKGTDKLTQDEIVTVLGCSEDVFVKAVYSGQESLPDLPSLTDKQIKELVEEAAGIEVLTKAYELAKANANDKGRVEERIRAEELDWERRIADKRSALEDMASSIESWEETRTEKVDSRTSLLRSCTVSAREIVAEQLKIDVAGLTSTLTAHRSRVSAVETERAQERAISSEVSSAQNRATKARAALDNHLRAIKHQQDHVLHVGDRVGKPCGECGKPYEEGDIAEAANLARKKLSDLLTEGRDLKNEADETNSVYEAKLKELVDFRITMTDVTETVTQISAIEAKINEHTALGAKLQTVAANAKRMKTEIDALKEEANPFFALKEVEEKRLTDLNESLVAARIEASRAMRDVQIAQAAVKTFGPAGVRAYVLDTVTPFLNERTGHYLGTLSDGRLEAVWTTVTRNAKGEMTERFAIEVQKTVGGKSFKALSGGEKRKVRLACAFALQDLVASRATKPISLWIGDEIDDALDEAGLERLMVVLEEKGREKGTVLVISHNSLRDWIRETVTVTMQDGRSTVSGALC